MKSAVLALILLAIGSPAHGESATNALMAAPLKAKLAGVALDLVAAPHAAFTPRYAQAPEPRMPGVAKTSLDRQFRDQAIVGSLGFLCGLDPGAERKAGAAAARGYDATGRFVGAKLRVAFR